MSASRPFVDRPVGDLEPAARLARRTADRLGLPEPVPMRTGMNALFAAGDAVIRVGRPSADPALGVQLAQALATAGIAVPRPWTSSITVDAEDGELAATVWERLEPAPVGIDWAGVGAIVRAVHELSDGVVPSEYPLPSPAGFPWWDFERMLAATRDEIDPVAWSALSRTVERHAGWSAFRPDRTVICHGDVHPGNVVMTVGGPVLVDWDLMCRAPAAWDHAALITWTERWGGESGVYQAFAEGYGADLGADAEARAFAELRNVAATLMRVAAGRSDPAAAAEAERRLRFWRNDPDAPPWRAQ